MYDVVGIENPIMDFAMQVDRLPTPDGGCRLNGYTWQGGNKVSTGLIAAARLGAKCLHIGRVGDDVFGRAVYADIKRHGVETSRMEVVPGAATTLAVILSDMETRGRSIMAKGGTVPGIAEDIDLGPVGDTRFLFIASLGGVNLRAARLAREAGAKVLMDADGPRDGMMDDIGLVDVFVASQFVYDHLFPGSTDYEKNCAAVRGLGPDIVVFTRGAGGCAGMDGSGFFELPAYDVPVVDTVGAGDVFHGAFLAGLLRGWDAKRTADFANAVSAVKCTRPGGRAGIPDFDTVTRFMRTGVIDYTDIDQRVAYYQRGLEHV